MHGYHTVMQGYFIAVCITYVCTYTVFCRPNSFAIYTANRIYDFVADSSGEMHMWIGALSPKKFSLGDDDILSTCLMKGQTTKELYQFRGSRLPEQTQETKLVLQDLSVSNKLRFQDTVAIIQENM